MNPIEFHETECPWCGSPLTLAIDCSAGDQRYVEDCVICCQPMVVSIEIGSGRAGDFSVDCARDD
ncbi:MAG: CPXCG motif-containing cysteine-rich protein [Chromatiaceae bacterium]